MKKMPLKLLIGLLAIYLLSGCVEAPKDNLVILHPHSSDFATHVIDGFKTWYKEETGTDITVDTIEKASGDCLIDVQTWNGTSPEADVWWGGGEFNFEQARSAELLVRYKVSEDANVKDFLGGWHLKDDSEAGKDPMWYAAAISGFGIIYNEEYIQEYEDTDGTFVPTTWENLTDPAFFGHISMCDPDLSGSTLAAVKQILQYMSDATTEITYDTNVTEGWQYWLELSGNVGTFTTSSSAVPTAVAEGNAGVGICIDYYALDKMLTDTNIGFTYGGATTVSPDPAGIIKGAANLDAAKKFMDYLIGTEGQTLVGDYRTPANFKADTADHVPKAWDSSGNPTTSFPAISPFSPSLDGAIHSRVEAVYTNYIVKNHAKAKAAWDAIGKQTDAAKKSNALAIYTRLPSDCNGTISGFRDLNYKETTTIENWQSEGAANFDAAKAAAT
ncbi:MAG: ABC transporter substrate-binding protein [Candidatus Hodarchaeota archaeon]